MAITLYFLVSESIYLHLRVRGGGVEDSKSIDSASEPCNVQNDEIIKTGSADYFLRNSGVSTGNVHTLSSSPSLSH